MRYESDTGRRGILAVLRRGNALACRLMAYRASTLPMAALVCLPAVLSPSSALALDGKDAQVIGRTLTFMDGAAAQTVVVAVVRDDASTASRAEADQIAAGFANPVSAGKIMLQLRVVPLDRLTSLEGANALYLAGGHSPASETVAAASRRLHVPTISTDPACLSDDTCVVAFASAPTVQITIDRLAAERADVRFLQAFRMLVKEK